jgi:hypothetical protein
MISASGSNLVELLDDIGVSKGDEKIAQDRDGFFDGGFIPLSLQGFQLLDRLLFGHAIGSPWLSRSLVDRAAEA